MVCQILMIFKYTTTYITIIRICNERLKIPVSLVRFQFEAPKKKVLFLGLFYICKGTKFFIVQMEQLGTVTK
jgi:hypothetical protein